MKFTEKQKEALKKELVNSLCADGCVRKIVVFGSFVKSNAPMTWTWLSFKRVVNPT